MTIPHQIRRLLASATLAGLGLASCPAITVGQTPPPARTDTAGIRQASSNLDRLNEFVKRDTVRSKAPSGSARDTANDAAFLALRPTVLGIASLDSASAVQYASAQKAYYDYHVRGLAHRSAVFEWQLFSSRVIFWIVIGLVATGVAFSGIQFRASLEAARAARMQAQANLSSAATGAAPSAAAPGTLALDTTLEATSGGIKLSSPVLGVIILGLSLLFFYLYLNFVYPIQESI